jgi:hypothetical protein
VEVEAVTVVSFTNRNMYCSAYTSAGLMSRRRAVSHAVYCFQWYKRVLSTIETSGKHVAVDFMDVHSLALPVVGGYGIFT